MGVYRKNDRFCQNIRPANIRIRNTTEIPRFPVPVLSWERVVSTMFERMAELRVSAGMRQIDVAKYLYVTQATYSGYENGRIKVPVEILMKLADLYGVSLDYLTGRTETR